MPIKKDILTRINERLDKTGECWIWQGTTKPMGYGTIHYDKKPRLVHRLNYQLLVGEIPVGLELDHLCRNRACANPEHLEPVEHRVNIKRSPICGKPKQTHCIHGHEMFESEKGLRYCKTCKKIRDKLRTLSGGGE